MTMGRGANGNLKRAFDTLGDVFNGETNSQKSVGIGFGMDIYQQALKALSLKHPFDVEESASGETAPVTSPPALGRPPSDRRKHRRTHGGRGGHHHDHDQHNSRVGSGIMVKETGPSSKLWLDVEEYFRPVKAEDVMNLLGCTQLTAACVEDIHDPCFFISSWNEDVMKDDNSLHYHDHCCKLEANCGELMGAGELSEKHEWEVVDNVDHDVCDVLQHQEFEEGSPQYHVLALSSHDFTEQHTILALPSQNYIEKELLSLNSTKNEPLHFVEIEKHNASENGIHDSAAIEKRNEDENEKHDSTAIGKQDEHGNEIHDSSTIKKANASENEIHDSATGKQPTSKAESKPHDTTTVAKAESELHGTTAVERHNCSVEKRPYLPGNESVNPTAVKLPHLSENGLPSFTELELPNGKRVELQNPMALQPPNSDEMLVHHNISENDMELPSSTTMEICPNSIVIEQQNLTENEQQGSITTEMPNSGDMEVCTSTAKGMPNSATSCSPGYAALDSNHCNEKRKTSPYFVADVSLSPELQLSHDPQQGIIANVSTAEVVSKQQILTRGVKRKLSSAKGQNKKRRICGSDFEVPILFLSPLSKKEESLCHICNGKDTEEDNKIIFCAMCGVAVHQECYGVQTMPMDRWLCSWCTYSSRAGRQMHESNGIISSVQDGVGVSESTRPCLLCPKSGGALKPVAKHSSDKEVDEKIWFAHLFCSQWIPETYIENTDIMEPIKNVEGIDEARWMLTCSLCKEKYGVCILCSHGSCTTAFHPLCAKEMNLWMGISSVEGRDDVGLCALCSTHSAVQPSRLSASVSGLTKDQVEINLSEYPKELITSQQEPRHSNEDAGKFSFQRDIDEDIVKASENIESIESSIKFTQKREANANDMVDESLSLVAQTVQIRAMSLTEVQNVRDSSSSAITPFMQDTKKIGGDCQPVTCSSETSAVVLEDVPAGIGDSAVDKHSNPKHASLKIQGLNESFLKDIKVTRNTEAVINENLMEEQNQKLDNLDADTRLVAYEDKSVGVDIFPSNGEIRDTRIPPKIYVHPYIQKRLLNGGSVNVKVDEGNARYVNTDWMTDDSPMLDRGSFSKEVRLKQLDHARNTGILDLAPSDELEGEILYLQNSLLDCARMNHFHSENLIVQVVKNLAGDQQTIRRQKQEALLVNEYMKRAREEKKQGRKEKRHKEAQATLAAAAAAAAASSRVSSSRKDGVLDDAEEYSLRQGSFPNKLLQPDDRIYPKHALSEMHSGSQPMKLSSQRNRICSNKPGRPSSSSQSYLKLDPFARSHIGEVPSESSFDTYQLSSESLGEEYILCDVCRLRETTNSNKIYTCHYCNVAVHQECYGIPRSIVGVWCCQPCETSRWQLPAMRFSPATNRARPGFGIECALCGGKAGAFKRTTNDQWVHIFCAEWILESTYRKGQTEPIGGLEAVFRERYISICSLCQHHGICIKCNFVHCQNCFHPICARDSGFFMTVTFHGGRTQHKAYCEKHSTEQKRKGESRQHGGIEELKAIKKMRVELERLRLICERIVRREKLKRDVLNSSHDILAAKRNCVAFSAVFHSSFSPPDVNSRIDTVLSLPNVTANRLWKEHSNLLRHEKLEENAVESATSGYLREILPSQSDASHLSSNMDPLPHRKINAESYSLVADSGHVRNIFSNSADSALLEDREYASRTQKKAKKRTETLQREVLMTPTEASMQNQRLPKGYAYVPVVYLSKGKVAQHDMRRQDS